MFRRLLPFLLIFLLILLDATVLPLLTGDVWFLSTLTLTGTLALGLLLGRTRGVLYGMIAGLLLDILTATPLGLLTMLYSAAGYFSGWTMRRWPRNPLAPGLGAAVLLSLYELFLMGYLLLASGQFATSMFWRAGVRVLTGTAMTLLMRQLFDWLIKPNRSRFAAM